VAKTRALKQGVMQELLTRYPKTRPLLVGGQGIPLETFFSKDAASWLVK